MVDHKKVEQAIRLLLEGIGEDPDREGLAETPDRIARMYEEICGGMNEDAAEHLKKTFTAENNEMVVEKDITFYSMCEHHMLPFYGKVHIAYIPDGKVVGLSKLARTVEVFARRLQLQEQMTAQIADALMENLHPKGVMVLAEAEHMCMTMRGIKKPGSKTVSVVTRGAFEELLKLEDKCKYAQEIDSTGAVMAKVAATPGAIGYVSLDVIDDTVHTLKIDGVEPTEENIKAGSYTLQRPFVMATKGEISEQSEAVQELFNYINSDEGQQIVSKVGLISAK